MNRVLVVGSRGMLGTDLMELLGSAAAGLDLPDIDITNRASITRALKAHHPDVVINCAAYTRVDDAEKQLDDAMRVNGVGAGLLAGGCAALRIKLVHLSTDFVFDGAKGAPYVEDDPTHPLSAYGATKLEGEHRVSGAGGVHLIVRTSWLYGAHGNNFVATIRHLASTKPELNVVDDQRGCPTWTRDLARAIAALIEARATGVVHACGSGICSWHEFAREIVRRSGLDVPVRPVTSAEFKRPARRPACSALDTSRLKQLTGFEFPRWQDSLEAFLQELDAAG